MVLQLAGDDAVVARVPNYLKDEPFIGLYDENPYYSDHGSVMPRPHPMGKYFSRGQSWAEKTNGKEGTAHPLPDTGPDALLNRLLAREARKR